MAFPVFFCARAFHCPAIVDGALRRKLILGVPPACGRMRRETVSRSLCALAVWS